MFPRNQVNISDPSRGSHVRTQDINIREISSIPPAERVISNSNRQRVTESISSVPYHPHERIHPQRTSTANEMKEILHMIVVVTVDHSEKEDILMKEEDPQGEEDYPVMEDPQIDMEEDHLMEEDHPMEEDPLMMEDHQMEMEVPQDALIEEDPQDLEDLLDQ